jgi:HEAT repeat protein
MRTRLAVISLCCLLAAAPALASKELAELEKQLKHFDYKERFRAIGRLEEIGGERASKLITTALADKDWAVQIRALEALGRLSLPETQEAVARAAVEGKIILVRRAAVSALKLMKDPDVFQKLLKAVRKGRAETPKIRALEAADELAAPVDLDTVLAFASSRADRVRAAAYRALRTLGDPKILKPALRGLRDKSVDVRVGACLALQNVESREAMAGLAEFVLGTDDPYVLERAARVLRTYDRKSVAEFLAGRARAEKKRVRRATIVRLLSEMRSPEAGEMLAAFLEDPNPEVRAWAARGIGFAGNREALGVLDKPLQKDENSTVRRMALEAALRLMEDKGERQGALISSLKNSAPEVRIRSCVILKTEGDISLLEPVYPLTEEGDWKVATAAAITIGTLGHKDQVEVLAKRVGDRDWRIRAAFLEGLGLLRHLDVFPYLIDALGDKDPVVKSAALKNLQVLSQKSYGAEKSRWERWYRENKDSYELTKKGLREEIEDVYAKSKYLIEILNKAQIVCVLGAWDHAEIVLEHLKIKHTPIRSQEIDKIGLNPKQLLLINCEGAIGKKDDIRRVEWFVHVGGFLMTTDWALVHTLQKAFPGYVQQHARANTGNDVVTIEAAAPNHPLLRGVFDRTTQLKWWLEIQAFPIRVLDPFRVEILVDSLEMLRKYSSSPMAIVFDFGHGKVEHCASHFYLQEEGLAGLTTVEQRKIFAADSLGISLDQVRKLESKGFFDGNISEAMTKEIAEDYSMFKLIVNFVVEKRKQVEQD